MDAYSPCLTLQRPRGARSRNRRACVAEKRSLTNRIRGQFARIKAAGPHRYQLWLLRKTRRPRQIAAGRQKRPHNRRNRKEVRESGRRKSGVLRTGSQDISKPKV